MSPKRNFLKKVAFWTQAKLRSKTRFIYGPQRSINENAHQRVLAFVTVGAGFTKIALISQTLTDADKNAHFVLHFSPSSLCSSRRTPPSHASQPRSALCSALRSALRGKLLPLLLLSFFRLLQHDFLFFFFFLISV